MQTSSSQFRYRRMHVFVHLCQLRIASVEIEKLYQIQFKNLVCNYSLEQKFANDIDRYYLQYYLIFMLLNCQTKGNILT